ncbi:hypothetical protein GGTG_01139 [Gaeumannomyces tritici R3-111a-1]|uniref:Uncharacterized protein n=1 Tax=Gaeumannomyces tritici (strain R3-111a-1) TaxID=644352 RepID=J3NIQ6_GAET3|nr:hypothetical protein GGTG_01139 [Gaeumannomyces tritici R3-111a-1]EJT81155.1 hypothetical protein GGTG_01139 [Gaeumannomyces tritici R3-111a-1]
MKPTTVLRRPALAPMPTGPLRAPPTGVAARVLPPLIIMGCVAGIASYVKSQLHNESGTMDRIFAQKNDERHEAARKKVYVDREPRRSAYNILSW